MSDNVIDIRPVKRGSAKLVIGLAAPSGEGKTYTALKLALGLAGGDPKKVGCLDTEGRADLYDDIFKEPFKIGVLNAPFSPERYIRAMRQFVEAGIEALVLDSMSAEYEGSGSIEEIANAPKADGTPRKTANWLLAKREHRRFMNTLLYLPCHIICCFRAREKMSFKDPTKPVSLGMQPITEKNVMYECTASFLLRNQGKERDVIKLPKCLEPILGGQGYLTEEHGKKLLDWVGGKDPVESFKNRLRLAASEGTDRLVAAWNELDAPTKKQLASFKDTLKDAAKHADDEKVSVKGVSSEPDDVPLESKPDINW